MIPTQRRGKQGGNLLGTFALHDDRLERVETSQTGIDDFVWQVKSANRLLLIQEQSHVGAKYAGATLERMAKD